MMLKHFLINETKLFKWCWRMKKEMSYIVFKMNFDCHMKFILINSGENP